MADLSTQKIVAPQGMYHGVFANHYTDPDHLACFEETAGEKVDISLRFTNFRELNSDEPFPITEAKRMKKRGGALYLILEPGSGKQGFDSTYAPSAISAGRHDKLLKNFVKEAETFGGPVFVSFRPPLSAKNDPSAITRAYIHLWEKAAAAGAKNITWVWNVNLDDENPSAAYPGDKYVDWISVTVYQAEGLDKLEKKIQKLKAFGKPILVEFGSSEPPAQKAKFVKAAIAKFNALGVKAFVSHNVSQSEGSTFKTWSLSSREEKAAYRQAIRQHEQFLRENIVTAAGELKGKAPGVASGINCKVVEQRYFKPGKGKNIEKLEKSIQINENYFKTFLRVQRGDPHYNNKKRIELARDYQYLFSLTQNESYLKKATHYLNEALNSSDSVLIYHWEKKFVREYFEILLTMANLYLQIDIKQASGYADRVFSDLRILKDQIKYFNPNQARKESYPGYFHKALTIRARILEAQGKLDEANELYKKIIAWADIEAKQTISATFPFLWKSAWYSDEDTDNVRYDGHLAKIKLGFINIKQNHNLEETIKYFKYIINWEKVGRIGLMTRAGNLFSREEKKAFLDLALAAFIGIMRAYAAADGLQKARERFNAELPWGKINKYHDLKKALNLEDVDLSSVYLDKWGLFIEGLSGAELPNKQVEAELTILRGLKK